MNVTAPDRRDPRILHKGSVMNTQRFLIALTAINIALLTISLARPGTAGAEGAAQVLRGRA